MTDIPMVDTDLVAAMKAGLRPGDTVFVGTGIGEPEGLIDAFTRAAPHIGDLRVIQVMTGGSEGLAEAAGNGFRLLTPVPGPKARRAISENRASFLPISMGQLVAGFASGRIPVDAVLLSAATPVNGKARPGIVVDCGPVAFEKARFRALEINPGMPQIGPPAFALSHADLIFENTRPLPTPSPLPQSPEAPAIAEFVTDLIPDGATIEIGVGQALTGIAAALCKRRNLAVHSGLLNDAVMDLVLSGTVSRPLDTKSNVVAIGTVAMGSRHLYRWLDGNDHVELRDSRQIQDAQALGALTDFVAVNSAFQIDLLGQANSIGFGSRILGGIGGALDFAMAGARGIGSIIVLNSTSADGRPRIAVDADWVSLPMPLVTHVVTEFGIATLHGKSPAQRAQEMIAVAHPDHREMLLSGARAKDWIV
ncbi:MAG: acetyl-CoA hydrolase/transferase family protein [Alphaproteobacteria bacterium]